jgi:hypothetical protein
VYAQVTNRRSSADTAQVVGRGPGQRVGQLVELEHLRLAQRKPTECLRGALDPAAELP